MVKSLFTRHKKFASGEKNRVQERNCDAALNLVCKYYGGNILEKRDVRPTRLVDFEGIAKQCEYRVV